MKHYYIVVEGPHDLAIIGRILSILGAKEVRNLNSISPLWRELIPTKYPFNESKLDRVTPIPSFHENKGTLEDLLLDSGRIVYNDLLIQAQQYVNKIDNEYKKKWSISSEKKVIIGTISNVLKPGKSNQVSISDDKWISREIVCKNENVQKLYSFIENFIKET